MTGTDPFQPFASAASLGQKLPLDQLVIGNTSDNRKLKYGIFK
jgi:hypothetical protein